ncbi:MFS transporter-like protein [Mytilinidion resinicola]|uniref:MFS transporter-like protein n=1 Tax=Mytilinidion resinicola TaxID=574789 RepID=A0A6A6YJ50_9PEZI|nr:MFS transporter-like protein [Mytilinidion resinicola]KAF2808831.1 MFS transporter-like protein [Mytilinidion resinicola]
MAFGVLEDARNAQPLGTTLLESVSYNGSDQRENARIILVPQPSDSPKDPLNMSRLRKELLFATIILGACATGVIGPLLVPGFSVIAGIFHLESLTKVTLLNGSLVMALGVSSYLCSCLAVVYGKRLIYLITSIMLVVTCCWGAAAQSYSSLLASRIFQGLGMGGFFALAGTASINDVFFVHERGLRVGLWNFAVIVSVNLTPVISGYVITRLSWRWSFWLLAILFGVLQGAVVLLFPETTFDRHQAHSSTVAIHGGQIEELKLADDTKDIEPAVELGVDYKVGSSSQPAPLWRRALGLQNLEIKDQSRVLKLCVTPLLILRHPAVIWGSAMWSVVFTWVIIQGAVADQIFQAPPYNMSTVAVGNLVGIAPMIGSALGTFIGGWACDAISQAMAIRNKGVFEPEFRLVIMLPFLVVMIAGSFGLGLAIHNELSNIVCAVFLALLNFAVGVGCTGIVAYSNDACQHRAGEAFGIAMLVKSAFAFGLTFMLNDYLATHGALVFFFTWGGLTVGVTATTLPLYVYGKQIRAWAERKQMLH